MPNSPASRRELTMLSLSIRDRFNRLDKLIEKINISISRAEKELERVRDIDNLSEEISWTLGKSVDSCDEKHSLSGQKEDYITFPTIRENFNKMKNLIFNIKKGLALHDMNSDSI